MTTEQKRGRGRPKGAPNKPVMELITERQNLTMNADVYEILCQAELVAQESEDLAVQGLQVFNERNGAVKPVLQWIHSDAIQSTLPEGKTPFGKNDAPASDLTETSLKFEFKLFKYLFFIINLNLTSFFNLYSSFIARDFVLYFFL